MTTVFALMRPGDRWLISTIEIPDNGIVIPVGQLDLTADLQKNEPKVSGIIELPFRDPVTAAAGSKPGPAAPIMTIGALSAAK